MSNKSSPMGSNGPIWSHWFFQIAETKAVAIGREKISNATTQWSGFTKFLKFIFLG